MPPLMMWTVASPLGGATPIMPITRTGMLSSVVYRRRFAQCYLETHIKGKRRWEPDMSDSKPLSFHVPAPAVRPGGTPDFSDVKISRAGQVDRPPVDVAPEKIRDHAFKIIRVLDRESRAVGPWAGLLSDAELLEGLRHMMTLRAFDQRMQM